MSENEHFTPAQETAKALLNIMNMCGADSSDEDGKITFTLYGHPDFEKICYGKDPQEAFKDLSEEEREEEMEELFDDYRERFKKDYLPVDPNDHINGEIYYIRAKLTGIVEGRITSGDGDLGRQLTDFTNKMGDLAKEATSIAFHERDSKTEPKTMQPEIAQLYENVLFDLQKHIWQGAGEGLFTSGQSIVAQNREPLMAEKYASNRTIIASDKGRAG
jgi:hypothetical protein